MHRPGRTPQKTDRNNEIIRLYMEEGYPLASIGRRLTVTRQRVRQILEQHDQRSRRAAKGIVFRQPRKHTPEMEDLARKMEELYAEGMYIYAIAEKCRISYDTTIEILKERKVIKSRGDALKFRNASPERKAALSKKIEALLFEEGKSISEIVKEVDLPALTVGYFLQQSAQAAELARKLARQTLEKETAKLNKIANELRAKGQQFNQITAALKLPPGSIYGISCPGRPARLTVKREAVAAVLASLREDNRAK